MNIFSIVLISGLFTLIIGAMLMITYYLGEQFGVAPDIMLGGLEWASAGEATIIYVVFVMASVFLGSFTVLYLIKRKG